MLIGYAADRGLPSRIFVADHRASDQIEAAI
jgi:hypothetical protein